MPTLSAKEFVTELVMQSGLRDAMNDYMQLAMESLEEGNIDQAQFYINVAANMQKDIWKAESKLGSFLSC